MGEPSTDQPIEPSASVRSRTRSGRMNVFGVPNGRLVRLRREHVDVAERLQRLLQGEQAARLDAVVVGDQMRGRVVHSASGRASRGGGARRGSAAFAGAPAGSPRSRSMSRRSMRCRVAQPCAAPARAVRRRSVVAGSCRRRGRLARRWRSTRGSVTARPRRGVRGSWSGSMARAAGAAARRRLRRGRRRARSAAPSAPGPCRPSRSPDALCRARGHVARLAALRVR